MNDFELLKRLDRVAAPLDFEDRVLAALRVRRGGLPASRRARTFRWSLAGASAALLALFGALNVFVLRGPNPAALASAAGGASVRSLAVDEPVNYRHEVRAASYDPGTVYILEQVSDASNTLIKY